METITVKVEDALEGTYWMNSRVSDCFESFISCENGRAISTNWLTWRTLRPFISFFRTAFETVTPGSAFEENKGESSNSGPAWSMISADPAKTIAT